MTPPRIRIITCPEWNAKPSSEPIQFIGQSEAIIFHHTASHGNGGTIADASEYAQTIQRYHMHHNGWIDSGHNFLVMRSGIILQGRWRTVVAIQGRAMVRSAHTVGGNTEIGIEHEHKGNEIPTVLQLESSARLQAWIAWHYQRDILPVHPHSAFNATLCPGNLIDYIPGIRARAREILNDSLRV